MKTAFSYWKIMVQLQIKQIDESRWNQAIQQIMFFHGIVIEPYFALTAKA